MAESLSLLSQEDLQQVEHVYQDSLRKFIALQALIRSEGNCQSPLLNGLKQAGTVALLRMRVCFSLRAAWRRLPIELWDRIFSHYLDNIRSGYPEAGIRTINKMATSAPRTLCLVSKFFNAVTQATSSIWKDMTVPTMEPPPDSSPLLVPIGNIGHILDRLNRVAATPHSSCLTISLDSDHDRDPAFRRAYDEDDEESEGGSSEGGSSGRDKNLQKAKDMQGIPLQALLQSHATTSSFERVYVSIPSNYRRQLPVQVGRLKFTAASSLVIVGPDVYPKDADSTLCFPAVKKAVLIGIVDSTTLNDIPAYVPWGQLTHLLLGDGISLAAMYSVLTLCTSLMKGSFWMAETLASTAPPIIASTLQHLTEFALFRSYNSNAPIISFHNFDFPALTRLSVFGDNVSFSTFSSLAHLSVISGAQRSCDLELVLDACPLLVELLATISMDGTANLDALVFHPDRPRGVFLQVIALICQHGAAARRNMRSHSIASFYAIEDTSPSIASLHAIASSRTPNGNPAEMTTPAALKRFVVRHESLPRGGLHHALLGMSVEPRDPLEQLRPAMQPLIANGLQVSIGILSKQTERYWPHLNIRTDVKHWDAGMDQISEDNWEYTTALGPPGSDNGV